MLGVGPCDYVGCVASIPTNGPIVAAGTCGNDENGNGSGRVRALSYCSTTSKHDQLGGALAGAALHGKFGVSASMPADGVTVVAGTAKNDDSVPSCSHTRVLAHSSTTKKWNRLGNDLVGTASRTCFGYSVSMPAGSTTVAAGTPESDDIGDGSGCARALAWSSTMNKHGCLGSTAAGSAACGWFREPVSTPTDDTNVEVGAPCNSGSSYDGGHGRVLT